MQQGKNSLPKELRLLYPGVLLERLVPSARGFGAGDAPSRVGSRGRASVGCPCAGWRVMALLFYVSCCVSVVFLFWLVGWLLLCTLTSIGVFCVVYFLAVPDVNEVLCDNLCRDCIFSKHFFIKIIDFRTRL